MEHRNLYGFIGVIVGSLVTGIITFGITVFQENKKLEFERVQYESSLILSSIDKDDIEKSKKNIRFLIESKLISAKNSKIIDLLTDSTFEITLPRTDTIIISPTNSYNIADTQSINIHKIRSGQIINDEGIPLEHVNIYINPCFNELKKEFYNCFAMSKTDKNGLFKIAIPESKNYKLLVEKHGYKRIYLRYLNSKILKYPEKFILEKE